MNHYFLHNDAINLEQNSNTYFDAFIEGMESLNAIKRDVDDEFQRHESVWSLPIFIELFARMGQRESLVVSFINQLNSIGIHINSEIVYDETYPNCQNAFLGINFSNLEISKIRQIIDANTFFLFKENILWNFTFRGFWERREMLFPNIILCGDVQGQIERIGDSGHFNQVVDKLREFNNAVKAWEEGNFNYKAINRDYPLRISPESDSTMAKYGNERRFSLPDGRRESFELHIKTGDLRFHFYPDNNDKQVYIGYIGPHLSIATG